MEQGEHAPVGAWQESASKRSCSAMNAVQSLINKGNARRVRLTRDGQTVLDVPLTVGVVGTVLAPHLAAAGAVLALATHCTLTVEPVSTTDGDPQLHGE